jgi:hypothetical protein
VTISEKDGLKKRQCIHLATIAASLAFGHVSDVGSCSSEGYVSPKAKFTSVENYAYSIDCEVKNELAGPAGSS